MSSAWSILVTYVQVRVVTYRRWRLTKSNREIVLETFVRVALLMLIVFVGVSIISLCACNYKHEINPRLEFHVSYKSKIWISVNLRKWTYVTYWNWKSLKIFLHCVEYGIFFEISAFPWRKMNDGTLPELRNETKFASG